MLKLLLRYAWKVVMGFFGAKSTRWSIEDRFVPGPLSDGLAGTAMSRSQ